MQLRIEINTEKLPNQNCVLCHTIFDSSVARVILCNDKNLEYGDICPCCIHQGPNWMQRQLRKIQYLNTERSRSTKTA